MPRIPVREQQVRRQTPQLSTPNVRVDVPQDVFLGGFERASGNISNALSKVADVLAYKEERDEKQKILDISTEFNKEVQDLKFSEKEIIKTNSEGKDVSMPRGLMVRKLKQAVDIDVDYEKEIALLKNKYSAGVDDRLKTALENKFNETYIGNRTSIIQHQTNQYIEDKEISLVANLETLKQQAISNPNSQNIRKNIEIGRGDIYANKMGVYGKEKTEIDMQVYSDDIVSKSVDVLLGNLNYEQAGIVLKENEDLISNEMYGLLDGKISAGKYLEIAKNLSNSGLTFEEQLNEADKIANPVLMNKVRDEIKIRENEKIAIEKQNKYAYEQEQWNLVFANPTNYDLRSQITKLDDETYNSIEKYINNKVDELKGENKTSNLLEYNRYMAMPIEDLVKVAPKTIQDDVMGNTEVKEVFERRRAGLMGDKKAGDVRTHLRVAEDLMKEAENKGTWWARTQKDVFGAKKKPSKLKAKEIKKQNEFFERFDTLVKSLPEKDRNDSRILNIEGRKIRDDLILSDRAKRNQALNNKPLKLKNLNVNYDLLDDVYYIDRNGIRTIFDRSGKIIKEGKPRYD